MIDRYLLAYERALALGLPPPPTEATLRMRAHDWWDRPMAYTETPPKPESLTFTA
ncbi:MAG: hypothetical protein JOY98_10335 [Candidatus Eremiobacteraeota bacterium]|nr:hypothetical protein [Candidatus Eremiobacteraeota bacterium]